MEVEWYDDQICISNTATPHGTNQGLQREKGVSEDVFLADQQPNSDGLNNQRNMFRLVETGLEQASVPRFPLHLHPPPL